MTGHTHHRCYFLNMKILSVTINYCWALNIPNLLINLKKVAFLKLRKETEGLSGTAASKFSMAFNISIKEDGVSRTICYKIYCVG